MKKLILVNLLACGILCAFSEPVIAAVEKPVVLKLVNGEPTPQVADELVPIFTFLGQTGKWEVQKKTDFTRTYQQKTAGAMETAEVVSFEDLAKSNFPVTGSTLALRQALREILKANYLNSPIWRQVVEELADSGLAKRITFVILPAGVPGPNDAFLAGYHHYRDMSFAQLEANGRNQPLDTLRADRQRFFSQRASKLVEEHFIFLNMPRIAALNAKLSVDTLPGILAHELTHAFDIDLLAKWSRTNLDLQLQGLPVDRLFSKFARAVDQVAYIDEGFRRIFLEARAAIVESQIEFLRNRGPRLQKVLDVIIGYFESNLKVVGELDGKTAISDLGFAQFLDSVSTKEKLGIINRNQASWYNEMWGSIAGSPKSLGVLNQCVGLFSLN